MARTLDSRSSILTLLTHPSYTLCRLKADPLGAPHVEEFETLRTDGTQVLTQEISLTEALVGAQAMVVAADARLNDVASRVSKNALIITRDDRSHPIYQLFFAGKTLSEFKKPMLGPQLEAMRAWQSSLEKSPHEALSALAPELQATVAEADAAEAARKAARQEIRHFRHAGERRQWVDRLNASRKALHGALAKLPHEQPGLPSDYANHFFLSGPPRETDAPGDEEPETADELRARLAELQADVAAIEARLAEVEAADADAKKAAEARAAEEAALAEMDKAAAEIEQKRAVLRARLAATPA